MILKSIFLSYCVHSPRMSMQSFIMFMKLAAMHSWPLSSCCWTVILSFFLSSVSSFFFSHRTDRQCHAIIRPVYRWAYKNTNHASSNHHPWPIHNICHRTQGHKLADISNQQFIQYSYCPHSTYPKIYVTGSEQAPDTLTPILLPVTWHRFLLQEDVHQTGNASFPPDETFHSNRNWPQLPTHLSRDKITTILQTFSKSSV